MKKIKYSLLILLGFIITSSKIVAQTAWIDPDPTDVTKSIKIYADLSKTTNKSLDGNPGPFYIWTWSPVSLPTGDPNQNGSGDKPWQNSNDSLIMTPEPSKGPRVFSFTMVPTKFYGCTPALVYQLGLAFLVKPKNGGGYGGQDFKTEDLIVPVNAPSNNRGLIYGLPAAILQNEITSIVYDNPLENKTTMQNLAADDCLLYIKATDAGGATYQVASFLTIQNYPQLQMKKMKDGRFKCTFILNKLLNIPSGVVIKKIDVTVRKKNWASSDDQTSKTYTIVIGCI
jgi:hypothetical protein